MAYKHRGAAPDGGKQAAGQPSRQAPAAAGSTADAPTNGAAAGQPPAADAAPAEAVPANDGVATCSEIRRTEAIAVMAAAAAAAAKELGQPAKVDLAAPDWALVAEALPVAGRGMMAGLAALPASMLTLKPKMQVLATAARDGGK